MRDKVLSIQQAIRAVEDILFRTSNQLYDLRIPLKELPAPANLAIVASSTPKSDLDALNAFIKQYPVTKFLRLQFIDYTATPRLRVIPIRRVLSILQKEPSFSIGIVKGALGLLQNDVLIPGVPATGEYRLTAIFSSLRPGPYDGYAFVQGEFREADGSEVELCPRTLLRRQLQVAKSHGLEFFLGFEIEVVFMSRESTESKAVTLSGSNGHAWSSARAMHGNSLLEMLNEINESLAFAKRFFSTSHSLSSSK